MSEREFTCRTCALTCLDSECPSWTSEPAPQPAPALPTLARVDRWIQNHHQQPAIIAVTGAEDIIVAVCPLLEAEECKATIEKAECWHQSGRDSTGRAFITVAVNGGVGIGYRSKPCATWPEARVWAEEQKAKREEEAAKQAARERIAKAGATLVETEYNGVHVWRIPMSFGAVEFSSVDDVKGDGAYYLRAAAFAEEQAAKREDAQWSPEVTDWMWEDDVCERVCDVLAYCHPRGCKDPAWLCGRASAMGRYDHERLRIWLGPLPLPERKP